MLDLETKMDPILSLSITLHANKGCYAVLLGSGVSRSAGIPTGWEIILDLSRRLARLKNQDCEPDPAAWYKTTFGQEPDYADLIDTLAKAPTERSGLLRPYFEPTSEERDAGLKLPTSAHKSIAQLVKLGVVKVIVTTNFDRLIEMALEEVGIVPQVIQSADAAEGALPLAHAECTIIKVHGDYRDTRIKNSPSELAEYDARIDALLDRVFDEYGLIICGWSADWDIALRAAIERCKGRRFSTYWIARGAIGDAAKRLIQLRSAAVVATEGADGFFADLVEKVISLDDVTQAHPVSAQVAIATLKRYIPHNTSRIRLADLIRKETELAYATLMDSDFLGRRIDRTSTAYHKKFDFYVASMTVPLSLMIQGCYWGRDEHVAEWVRMLERFAGAGAEFFDQSIAHPDLRMYPATLLLYAGGIAAIVAEKYEVVAALLMRAQARQLDESRHPVSFTCAKCRGVFDAIRHLEGMEGRHTPESDYIHVKLRPLFGDLEPDNSGFDLAFDRFECLMALAIGDMIQGTKSTGRHTMQSRYTVPLTTSMPVGRFGWRRRNSNQDMIAILREEQQTFGTNWGPLAVGMFCGEPSRFNALLGTLESRIDELPWN